MQSTAFCAHSLRQCLPTADWSERKFLKQFKKPAWEQDPKMQDCGLAKHFSSIYYLSVWISSQRPCLYR